MSKPLTFTKLMLVRENQQRKNTAWVKQQLFHSCSQVFPVWQGQFFFQNNELLFFSAETLSLDEAYLLEHSYLLGVEQLSDVAVFVLDLSPTANCEQEAINQLESCRQALTNKLIENKPIELKEFRASLAWLEQQQMAMLGYGRALSLWHQSSRYCGYCGEPTQSEEAGHARRCTNSSCNKLTFPRTDAVVIMLVEYIDEQGTPYCLLAGHHRTPDNLVSTLAGFVDPGESLEQAVKREVFEEAGVEVAEVEYSASQPWPFPHSLMIGFYAKALNNQINIDPNEISHANWYSVEQVSQCSDWGSEGEGLQIPRKESIARHLINGWLAKHGL